MSIAGSAIATLEKEFTTGASQKITKSVKAPHLKPGEPRGAAEKVVSQPFSMTETTEAYKARYDVDMKRDVGVSVSGGFAREDRFQYQYEVGYRETSSPSLLLCIMSNYNKNSLSSQWPYLLTTRCSVNVCVLLVLYFASNMTICRRNPIHPSTHYSYI